MKLVFLSHFSIYLLSLKIKLFPFDKNNECLFLQIKLRKKDYDFDASDKIVDSFFKLREDAAKNNEIKSEPPPTKKSKLEESVGTPSCFYLKIFHSNLLIIL